jgi:hypothetical protein
MTTETRGKRRGRRDPSFGVRERLRRVLAKARTQNPRIRYERMRVG